MRNRTIRRIAIAIGFGLALSLQVRSSADDNQAGQDSIGNLKNLALAMHNFYEANRSLPPNASYKKGKPLLSWRVHLLPFLDEKELFNKFRVNEPWDSPHNKKLIGKMPKVFADPYGKAKKTGTTRYLGPLGADCIFSGKRTASDSVTLQMAHPTR